MTATTAMPSSSVATAKVRSPPTYRSAMTISLHIASSAVATAKKIEVTPIVIIAITIVSAVSTVTVITIVTAIAAAFNVTPASRQGNRQGRHQGEPKPNPDLINRTVRLAHTELPFEEEIKKCGWSENFTKCGLLANRIFLSPRHAPQTRYAAVIESPNVNFIFGLIFMRSKSNPGNLLIAMG